MRGLLRARKARRAEPRAAALGRFPARSPLASLGQHLALDVGEQQIYWARSRPSREGLRLLEWGRVDLGERSAEDAVREIAGAKRLVERLLDLPNVRVGIATGGWEPTALLKLTHVGIGVRRLGFASSSDARARTDIMRIAAHRAMGGAEYLRATYFGDGAWDRRASTELGYDFVAIGGGVPNPVAYADLRDTDAILAQLGLS